MLTPSQIESSEDSINDVADLRMRIDIALCALDSIAEKIKDSGGDMNIYHIAVNEASRIKQEHSCNVELHGSSYRCECGLIVDGE